MGAFFMPKGVYPRKPLRERFFECVKKTDSCWIWTGFPPTGYGQFSVNSRAKLAHRVAFELLVGPIPKGLHVRHSCNNQRCVNPEHLAVGTHTQNMLDRKNNGKYNWRYAGAKLTPEIVKKIRSEYRYGVVGYRVLSERYNISETQVGHIVRREQWQSV